MSRVGDFFRYRVKKHMADVKKSWPCFEAIPIERIDSAPFQIRQAIDEDALRVLPVVPYRQWLLAFPRSLRLRLGDEKSFFAAARRLVLAAIFTWQRRAARRQGIAEPLVGAISFAQRFASNLSLHPHLHLVVPDGVFFEADGRVLFRALPKPTVEAVERVAARIARRVHRWLEQHQLLEEPLASLIGRKTRGGEWQH